jgi:hypothetical protein
MKKKSEPIDHILKRYKDEWLLIAPDKVDERTLKIKTGRLIAHSPRKEDLEETLITYKGNLYSLFSGPPLPPGFRAAF